MSQKKIFNGLLLTFLLFSYLSPTLIYNKIVFCCLLLFVFCGFYSFFYKTNWRCISPIIIFIIFFYSYLLSLFSECDMDLCNQLVIAQFLLLLIYPIRYYGTNLDKYLKIVGVILSLSILIIYVSFFVDTSFALNHIDLLKQYFGLSISNREFISSSDSTFSFLGSNHMFLPFSLFFFSYTEEKKRKLLNLLCLIIIGITIVISGARAQIIITLIICSCIYVKYNKVTTKQLLIYVFLALFLVIGIVYIISETTVFSSTEYSNEAKLGEIESFFKEQTFLDYLFGKGLGSYYYVDILQKRIAETEISFLDMTRYCGLLLACLYYICLFCPLKVLKEYRKNRNRLFFPVLICLCFFIYSLSNPVIINSLGYSVILWYWSKL